MMGNIMWFLQCLMLNIYKNWGFFGLKKAEYWYESDEKKPRKYRKDGKLNIWNKPWTQWMNFLYC